MANDLTEGLLTTDDQGSERDGYSKQEHDEAHMRVIIQTLWSSPRNYHALRYWWIIWTMVHLFMHVILLSIFVFIYTLWSRQGVDKEFIQDRNNYAYVSIAIVLLIGVLRFLDLSRDSGNAYHHSGEWYKPRQITNKDHAQYWEYKQYRWEMLSFILRVIFSLLFVMFLSDFSLELNTEVANENSGDHQHHYNWPWMEHSILHVALLKFIFLLTCLSMVTMDYISFFIVFNYIICKQSTKDIKYYVCRVLPSCCGIIVNVLCTVSQWLMFFLTNADQNDKAHFYLSYFSKSLCICLIPLFMLYFSCLGRDKLKDTVNETEFKTSLIHFRFARFYFPCTVLLIELNTLIFFGFFKSGIHHRTVLAHILSCISILFVTLALFVCVCYNQHKVQTDVQWKADRRSATNLELNDILSEP